MGYAIMQELKEPYVCEKECSHTDCAATRKMVNSLCKICKEPVRSGQKFYSEDFVGFTHALCEMENV